MANHVRWELVPPPGMAFKNEVGGSVTIIFEDGREDETYRSLASELDRNYENTVKVRRAREEAARLAAMAVPVPMQKEEK